MDPHSAALAIIADDDEFFRLAMVAILTRSFGFAEVIETQSLDMALETLAERGADVTLALFDLMMPGMDGAASLAAVRGGFPWVKVAVVSALNERAEILAALEVGAHGYILKGAGSTELSRAVGRILDGQIVVPASLADFAPPSAPTERARPAPVVQARTERSPGDRTSDLTPRQREVLALLVQGKSNKEIARGLHLGEGTVKVHVAALLRILDAPNRAAAAVIGTTTGR